MGKWKAVRTDLHKGIVKTQLYDLLKDIREEYDVASSLTGIVKKDEEVLKNNHVQSDNKLFRIKSLGDSI